MKVSLRSVKNDDGYGDCESIANYYRGGGHYNAASFFVTTK